MSVKDTVTDTEMGPFFNWWNRSRRVQRGRTAPTERKSRWGKIDRTTDPGPKERVFYRRLFLTPFVYRSLQKSLSSRLRLFKVDRVFTIMGFRTFIKEYPNKGVPTIRLLLGPDYPD